MGGNIFFMLIHGDLDSLTHLLEPKNIEMFHSLWNFEMTTSPLTTFEALWTSGADCN